MEVPLYCHLLIGPPGSGKSTLAKRIQAEIPHSCIVSTDQIRQDLYGCAAEQGVWSEIEAEVIRRIGQGVERGQSVIYDATNARRVWRMTLLRRLSPLGVDWVGWYLKTPLATCRQWNRERDRQVPPEVIESAHLALRQFPPLAAEGFRAVYSLGAEASADDIQAKLKGLDRGRINRRNRHSRMQSHRYSTLLDFDRLLHLVSLLVQYPGLGHLQEREPERLQRLVSATSPSTFPDEVAEICAVVARQRGALYANPEALTQDLAWLEENGFLSSRPTVAALTRPGAAQPVESPHPYSDWESFQRVMTFIRFVSHHPLCWQPELQSSLGSVAAAMQAQGLLAGETQAALRKDIEQVLKPFGLLPAARLRRGYFLGSGILSESDLLKVTSVLQAQAKNIEDPTALGLLDTLRDRLQRSQHDLANLYPVRAIGNRSIVDVERLPPESLARTLSRLEDEIEAGQLLELNRFAGVGRFEPADDGFFWAWPLQIVFHNIAWYLAYERADGPEVGLFQFERLDRLFRGRPQPQQRAANAQRQALHRLQRLYEASGGLFLGHSAKMQRQFLSARPADQAQATLTLELWFTDALFAFISEGTQRFPLAAMKMSPKPAKSKSSRSTNTSDVLFSLPPSPDPTYPNRLQVALPRWVDQDRDLRRWILGFGSEVKLVAPEAMVAEIAQLSQELMHLYHPDGDSPGAPP
ncbi:MAG: AAA family ATPase [Leptolyngbya sp.]|nr:AAA family ATPase [Leptolyngbya sp.]